VEVGSNDKVKVVVGRPRWITRCRMVWDNVMLFRRMVLDNVIVF
jgi:hypothetical protein